MLKKDGRRVIHFGFHNYLPKKTFEVKYNRSKVLLFFALKISDLECTGFDMRTLHLFKEMALVCD